ncbi:hypothetical protein [Methylobacterium sp. J-076]|uniref:hypothetical protein n=1 Tax=Methylobacterium sp. J-076 TaxID=2836655 RepID=UPI001FB8733D|nr:hypothetical protein [Methylobacterium sp. J-076]MCJ2013609.1 hypothetical protein [Methylobacterium sp. J-076]
MLWYEARVVEGQRALVPVLLLPPGDLARYTQTTGGTISGGDIVIPAFSDLCPLGCGLIR